MTTTQVKRLARLNAYLALCVLVSSSFAAPQSTIHGIHGTLVIGVPVSEGIVVCSDKRLFNDATGKVDDTFVKIRKVNNNTLFVATNTIGFVDKTTGKMTFDVYDITAEYAAAHAFESGSFWNGLKQEIRKQLLAYLGQQKFADWPETDKANNDLLFNLVFYSTAGNHARSYSLSVFYEKAQVPLITIPGVISEDVRTPKLSGKGKDVMFYLSQHPNITRDPAILRFDESHFDIAKTSVVDAVNFAKMLFTLTNSAVPRAEVSAAHDCSLLSFKTGFTWVDDSGLPINKLARSIKGFVHFLSRSLGSQSAIPLSARPGNFSKVLNGSLTI